MSIPITDAILVLIEYTFKVYIVVIYYFIIFYNFVYKYKLY